MVEQDNPEFKWKMDLNRKLIEEQIQMANCLQIPSVSVHTCPLTVNTTEVVF